MAKIHAPLFSLSASGTVNRITFLNTEGVQTARARTFRRAPSPTASQLAIRNNVRAAATAWEAMTPDERDIWKTRGLKLRYASDRENLTTLHNGWALYLQEWIKQQASAERLPWIPT